MKQKKKTRPALKKTKKKHSFPPLEMDRSHLKNKKETCVYMWGGGRVMVKHYECLKSETFFFFKDIYGGVFFQIYNKGV